MLIAFAVKYSITVNNPRRKNFPVMESSDSMMESLLMLSWIVMPMVEMSALASVVVSIVNCVDGGGGWKMVFCCGFRTGC